MTTPWTYAGPLPALWHVDNVVTERCDVLVELISDTDFAGLFEVKEDRVREHEHPPRCEAAPGALVFLDTFGKQITVAIAEDAVVEPGLVTWRFVLGAHDSRELCVDVGAQVGDAALPPRLRCGEEGGASVRAAAPRAF